jgi:hypothetical protein
MGNGTLQVTIITFSYVYIAYTVSNRRPKAYARPDGKKQFCSEPQFTFDELHKFSI